MRTSFVLLHGCGPTFATSAALRCRLLILVKSLVPACGLGRSSAWECYRQDALAAGRSWGCCAVRGRGGGVQFGRVGGPPRIAPPAPAPWRTCTEQVTLATPVGHMRACVDYRYAHDRLKVLATAASYASSSGYDLPYFTFVFRDPSSAVIDYKFSSPFVHAENVFSHNTGLIDLARTADGTHIHAGEVLQVALRATSAHSGYVEQMASVTLTLYPRGLWCPELGSSASYGESASAC